MLRCKGCGALLQYTDPKAAGYSPKEGAEYCQRCFRIMHYGDLTVSMKKGIDPDVVMKRIAEEDALILWVCDLFDFEAGMITGLNRRLEGKDIVMIATKRDLLPQSTGEEKLADFVFSRLKEEGIRINSLIIAEKGKSDWIEDIWDAIDELAEGRKILVMGKANSGKSTLLNRLMEKDELTASRYPGTTMDFNEITIRDHTFIDTPGIMNEHSLLLETEEDDLKEILPAVRIKPQVFQVKGNQSFAIGGLARIDVYDCEKASIVFYVANSLNIHRSKAENADELWEKHYGEMLKPVPLKKEFRRSSRRKETDKMDIVIDGLGWACVHGKMSHVEVSVPQEVNVTYRKAML